MAELRLFDSIQSLERERWNRCFSGELEDYDYYLAVEQAGVPDFELRYFAVIEGPTLLAVAPAFITEYRLDTTVQGPWKRLGTALDRLVPWATRLRLVCFGSPVSETCHIGIADDVAPDARADVLARLFAGLEKFAEQERIGLLGVKDVPADNRELAAVCVAAGYRQMAGLPTACLDLPYTDREGYFRALSPGARKDLRRKLKAAAGLRFERRHTIDDVADQITALYAETLDHAELQFERLPPSYFTRVLDRMGERASCTLVWQREQLVAFNLLLHDDNRVIDKFLGMHYPLARSCNLYFATWMANVQLCIDKGIPLYQSGQGGYGPKRHLGSRLTGNALYFRHRRPWINRLLRLLAPLVRLDRFDPELRIVGRSSR